MNSKWTRYFSGSKIKLHHGLFNAGIYSSVSEKSESRGSKLTTLLNHIILSYNSWLDISIYPSPSNFMYSQGSPSSTSLFRESLCEFCIQQFLVPATKSSNSGYLPELYSNLLLLLNKTSWENNLQNIRAYPLLYIIYSSTCDTQSISCENKEF